MRDTKLVCIAGKNQIASECLIHAFTFVDKIDLVFLQSKPDSAMKVWQPEATEVAKNLGIKILDSIDEIKSRKNLIFISTEYDQIISPSDFASSDLFNLHFSYLPKYRGVYTSFFPILHGENFSGVTLHLIDEGIDSGPIIDQIKFDIPPLFRSFELYNLYTRYGYLLFQRNFHKIITGAELVKVAQTHTLASNFSRKSFSFSDTEIFMDESAEQIINRVRALTFPAFQKPEFLGRTIDFIDRYSGKTLSLGQVYWISVNAARVGTKTEDLLFVFKEIT